jgi:predicted ribosome quality control (RQC) complex YloA/Tae2 family protein
MKNRLSSIDVAAECACLKKLLGLRLTNVYDISAKTYVLKLSKSGEEGEKHLLLLESGARFHTIEVRDELPPIS